MIELRNGDKLRLVCSFQHKGKAYSGAKAYAAIGKKNGTFNEISPLNGTTTITGIVDDGDWTTYRVNVDIPIKNIGTAGGITPGDGYEVYAKLVSIPGDDIFWYGPLDDIALVSDSAFKGLYVEYSKS